MVKLWILLHDWIFNSDYRLFIVNFLFKPQNEKTLTYYLLKPITFESSSKERFGISGIKRVIENLHKWKSHSSVSLGNEKRTLVRHPNFFQLLCYQHYEKSEIFCILSMTLVVYSCKPPYLKKSSYLWRIYALIRRTSEGFFQH